MDNLDRKILRRLRILKNQRDDQSQNEGAILGKKSPERPPYQRTPKQNDLRQYMDEIDGQDQILHVTNHVLALNYAFSTTEINRLFLAYGKDVRGGMHLFDKAQSQGISIDTKELGFLHKGPTAQQIGVVATIDLLARKGAEYVQNLLQHHSDILGIARKNYEAGRIGPLASGVGLQNRALAQVVGTYIRPHL